MRCRLAEIPQIGVRRGGLDGAGTFELHVVAPDLEAYSRWAMEMLSKLPNVKDTQTRFSLKEVKADMPGRWGSWSGAEACRMALLPGPSDFGPRSASLLALAG
jgi:hypothetical protein